MEIPYEKMGQRHPTGEKYISPNEEFESRVTKNLKLDLSEWKGEEYMEKR
jgi:hypothetical protein